MFGDDLPREERFVAPVRKWLAMLFERGAAETVKAAGRL
jgi:hypothetical protein